ncbi:hypothetical protein HYV83_01275 [Candidatus Woesearchaeota archaeon]|nr:hypothetical protein [Candidatus Woesearchaeota archaeon]
MSSNGTKRLFSQNDVPSIEDGHIVRVREVKDELTQLMRQAYPQAYRSGFNGKPNLMISIEELEGGIERVLDHPTVSFLVGNEAQTRPVFEDKGLQITFESIVPVVFGGFNGSTQLTYKVVIDAQCVGCMRQNRFAPMAGMMYGTEFEIGQQRLDDVVQGGWRGLVVTDQMLAEEVGLKDMLTPTCQVHGKDEVSQLAVVHQVFATNPAATSRKGAEKSEALPGSPVVEARLKTTFEYLWKYVKFVEGQRTGMPPAGVPDAFAARVRAATEKEAALAIVGILMASPQMDWYGAVIPQNYDNGDFNDLMTTQLAGKNGMRSYFKSRIMPNATPEEKPLVTRRNGVEKPANYTELLRPFGNRRTTADSNAVDTLVYPPNYADINGIESQSRIGYEERKHRKRETATAGDWMIALRLAGISLDPSSVAYNQLIVERRLSQARAREESRLA